MITAEHLAINAAMAGCLPTYVPVLVAAVEAITDPAYKFNHMASLGSPWPMFVVNGPLSRTLGFNSGLYLFGPTARANGTCARAISLLLWNCVEARPDGIQRGQWVPLCVGSSSEGADEEVRDAEGDATGRGAVR